MAWGGWVEVDAIRCEIALLMVHSHIGYAHATVARLSLASRIVDDYINKTDGLRGHGRQRDQQDRAWRPGVGNHQ